MKKTSLLSSQSKTKEKEKRKIDKEGDSGINAYKVNEEKAWNGEQSGTARLFKTSGKRVTGGGKKEKKRQRKKRGTKSRSAEQLNKGPHPGKKSRGGNNNDRP